MTYSINKDEIQKIAEELGLKVKFNSPTPGVLNLKTGERKSVSSYFEDFITYESVHVSDSDFDILKMKAKKVKVNRLEYQTSGAVQSFDLDYYKIAQ